MVTNAVLYIIWAISRQKITFTPGKASDLDGFRIPTLVVQKCCREHDKNV